MLEMRRSRSEVSQAESQQRSNIRGRGKLIRLGGLTGAAGVEEFGVNFPDMRLTYI